MMSRFHLALEAENTERRCHRSYTIMASMDLFGTWIVEIWFGRIGSRGRSMRYAFGELEKAQKLVRMACRRRMSAPKRLGVPYIERIREDPDGWLE